MILDCNICEEKVNAVFIAEYGDREIDSSFPLPSRYKFWRCPNCGEPFLTEQMLFPDIEIVLYPPNDYRINPTLPNKIKLAYHEAVSCFNSKAYTATAIMCRKTLEGICAEHGATGNNLVSNLKELKEKGVIENRLYEWADALRISGNEAAHDVNVTVSKDDAMDLLEFTNALLEYIFTFRDKFEKFKQRRPASQSRPRSSTDAIEL
jgi:hypothetical protein